jgi:prepilin-type N-terminal cleavage/methylation domain-containing protein
MKLKRRSHSRTRRIWQRGFTLIEMLVIIAVMGILAAVAAPSFTAMMDGIKVTQTVTNLKTALQDTQRQAIRKNQICTVQVPKKSRNGNGNGNGNAYGNENNNEDEAGSQITGNCLTSGSPKLPDNVNLATNMQSTIPVAPLPAAPLSNVVEVKFDPLGSATFSILSEVKLPLLPIDPTGKVVAFVENPTVPKKCVAISSTLGLTRVGVYTGSTVPADITDKGICTALDWRQQ